MLVKYKAAFEEVGTEMGKNNIFQGKLKVQLQYKWLSTGKGSVFCWYFNPRSRTFRSQEIFVVLLWERSVSGSVSWAMTCVVTMYFSRSMCKCPVEQLTIDIFDPVDSCVCCMMLAAPELPSYCLYDLIEPESQFWPDRKHRLPVFNQSVWKNRNKKVLCHAFCISRSNSHSGVSQ